MKEGRFSEEQIVAVLRKQEMWAKTQELCWRRRSSNVTSYKRRNAEVGGLGREAAQRTDG